MGDIRTLADACSDIVDCAHKTAPIDESGAYFAVGTPAMRGNVINFDEARRIDRETYEDWTTRLRPRRGDLLLAREAPVGPVVRIPDAENVAPGQRTVLLRPREGTVDSLFLFYYLTSPSQQAELLVKASGSTVPHLNVADVRAFPTPCFPRVTEQRAIADILGALDDKIAANQRAVATSREWANARFVQSARGSLKVLVSDVVEMLSRGVTPKYAEHDGMLVLNQKCVRDQRVSLASARLMVPLSTRLDRVLRPEDVLVNSTGVGTLGRAARWTGDRQATVDSHITIVRFNEQVIDPVCAGFALLRLESQIEALAEGSTGQTELRRDLLGGLMLEVPTRPAQRSLGEELSKHDALERALISESDKLAHTRDELLPLLMSGKVRVKDAEAVASGVL